MSRITAERIAACRAIADAVADEDDPRLANWPDMSVQPRRRRTPRGHESANDGLAQNWLRVAEYDAFHGDPGAKHWHEPGHA